MDSVRQDPNDFNADNESTQSRVRRAAEAVYIRDGAVVEIRAFKSSKRGFKEIYAGWADCRETFVEAALALEKAGCEVYATLNPCDPDLLARRDNAIAPADKTSTPQTSDLDILRRRWILVDLDPNRKAKVSSTDAEKAEAFDLAARVRADLLERGIPAILADSGNGAHILIPVDLPNTGESGALVEGVLKGLDAKYSNPAVSVDVATANASRISKVYGTTARKGQSVERIGRVHRPSAILDVPEGLEPVPADVLRALVPAREERREAPREEWDLAKWIEDHDVPVKRDGVWNGYPKWILEECPWNGHADGAAWIGRREGGAVVGGCLHNSCKEYSWRDIRKHFEPGAYERTAAPVGERDYALTDVGNGERFAAQHGKNVRWIRRWKKHLVWDGRVWSADDREDVSRKAQQTAKGIHAEASRPEVDLDRQRKITAHAIQSQSERSQRAMVNLAKPHMTSLHTDFDSDPWLLNCQNGTIDLRTGTLQEHRRADSLTKVTPVEYDTAAEAPTFRAFLEQILPSPSVRSFLKRAFGMALSGEIRDNVLMIMHGTGSNGKSTLMEAVMAAFGDYAIAGAPDLLMATKSDKHATELADLFGARLVSCMESDEGRRLKEGLVKQLTGRDTIKARQMHEDWWSFDPTHTIFLGTNHKPEIRGTDHAIWRRLKLVPFTVTIPDDEQDKDLPEKLQAELPGVLRWAVEGCLEWQRDGLDAPEEVTDATGAYKADMDDLEQFIDEVCVVAAEATAPATPLYRKYAEWCDGGGEAPLKQRAFGTRLGERGFESFKYTSGPHKRLKGWRGIGIRGDKHDPEDDDRSAKRESGGDERAHGGDGGTSEDHSSSAQSGVDKRVSPNSGNEGDKGGPKNNVRAHEDPRKEEKVENRSPSSPSSPPSDKNRTSDSILDEALTAHEAGDTPLAERRARRRRERREALYQNDPARYDEMPEEHRDALRTWIREAVVPKPNITSDSSYRLKECAEADLGIYVHNSWFKAAMLEAGHAPVWDNRINIGFQAGPSYAWVHPRKRAEIQAQREQAERDRAELEQLLTELRFGGSDA